MWRVTISGLMAKKLRLVLTSIAVVLGVAFMSGTFVLTDTLGSVFDKLFTDVTKGVDADVRARRELDSGRGNFAPRNPVPESLVPVVEGAPGVKIAHGTVGGFAAVVGTDGDTVQNGNSPTNGFSWLPRPFGEANVITRGHKPEAADEVVLDEKTASESGYKLGDEVPIIFLTGTPEKFQFVGVFRFGDSDSTAGATRVAFTPRTALRVVGHDGEWDSIYIAAKPGVSQQALATNVRKVVAATPDGAQYEVLTGKELADEQAST